jgi:type I restriction enzyme, S subunit
MIAERIHKVPNSWATAPVKQVFSVLNGATPSTSEQSYWDGKIYWATPEDIGSLKGRTITDTKRKITEDGYANSGTQIAPVGSRVYRDL